MRILIFSRRTAKEILRDPLTLIFGIGFPVILLLLMTTIQKNVPIPLFVPEQLTPGITTFGLSFLGLFTAMLVSKDRGGSLLARLRATPMTAADFFFGYLLPVFPMALCQMTLTYAVAMLLGLPWSWKILPAILVQIPMALCFLAIGLICGCLMTERQASGVCGALLTNLSAWLSGAWFDLKLVGGWFERTAYLLPFANATEAGRRALQGFTPDRSLLISCVYAAGLLCIAAWISGRLVREE